MVVDHVGYPDLAVAVARNLVAGIVAVCGSHCDCLFWLPCDGSCNVECSQAELDLLSTGRFEARLVVAGVEDAGPVRGDAEVMGSNMNRYTGGRGPAGSVR